MDDLISRRALYDKAATLEAQALDYVGKLIERDGEEYSTEWKIWSAILAKRTAFKHDVFDAPSAQPEKVCIANITLSEEQIREAVEKAKNEVVRVLPSAQPERKKGKWIIVTDSRGRHAECPYCGEWKYHLNQKFCGECGSRMEVETE